MNQANIKEKAKTSASFISTAQEVMANHVAANDDLYAELEGRYGGDFAQWVMDHLSREEK